MHILIKKGTGDFLPQSNALSCFTDLVTLATVHSTLHVPQTLWRGWLLWVNRYHVFSQSSEFVFFFAVGHTARLIFFFFSRRGFFFFPPRYLGVGAGQAGADLLLCWITFSSILIRDAYYDDLTNNWQSSVKWIILTASLPWALSRLTTPGDISTHYTSYTAFERSPCRIVSSLHTRVVYVEKFTNVKSKNTQHRSI